MQLYTRGRWIMPSILLLFPYKDDGGRSAAFFGSCVQDSIMQEICFPREECSFCQLGTNASFLNLQ